MTPEKITIKCTECGINDITISKASYDNNMKLGKPIRCKECMHKYRSELMTKRNAERTPEEKDKQRLAASISSKKRIANMTPEAKQAMLDRINAGAKKWRENETDEERERISKIHSESNRRRWANMSDEERECLSSEAKERWANLSDEEKIRRANITRDRWVNAPDSLREKYAQRMSKTIHEFRANMSDEEREEFNGKISESMARYWANLSDNERGTIIGNHMRPSKNGNEFVQRFQLALVASSISSRCRYVSEYRTQSQIAHSWDYGIFNENGELQMLIDLDGAYYHADICDYDGIHSKEEYDERRGLSIPDGVKWCLFTGYDFDKCFAYMEKCFALTYDEFMKQRFKEYHLQPFPEPAYSTSELKRSWNDLCRLNQDDQYHQSLSVNTRNGDRIIQHFHHSLYDTQREAWRDDEALRKLINERAMYQCYLNKNKILQGLNVSQIVPSVRYMSAGKAKMIVSRYLSDYDTIFDPNMV